MHYGEPGERFPGRNEDDERGGRRRGERCRSKKRKLMNYHLIIFAASVLYVSSNRL